MMTTTKSRPSHPELSRRSSFAWTFAGRAVYGAAQWGMLVALAKLGSIADVGRFSLGLAVTAPAMVFCNMHLRNLYATDVENRFSFATFSRVRRVTALIGLLVCLVMAAALYDGMTAGVIALVAVAKAVEMLEDLRYGVFQRFGRMDRFSTSLILRAVLGLGLLCGLLVVTDDLRWAVGGLAGAWLVVWLVYDRPQASDMLRARANAAPRSGPPRALVMMALPMGLMWLIDSLNQNLPRYAVEAYQGEEALGFYVPMTYVVTIGSAFVFALGAPLAPRLARYVAERSPGSFARASFGLLALGAGLGVAGLTFAWAFGDLFLALAYADAFAAYHYEFVWIMLGGGLHFVMALSMYALTAARYLRTQAVLFSMSAVVTGCAAWAWVPGCGLLGAAQASTLGLAVGVVGSVLALIHAWRGLREREPQNA